MRWEVPVSKDILGFQSFLTKQPYMDTFSIFLVIIFSLMLSSIAKLWRLSGADGQPTL